MTTSKAAGAVELQQERPTTDLPEDVKQALIQAECALANIAESDANDDKGDLLEWAENRAAKALLQLRPLMRRFALKTSE